VSTPPKARPNAELRAAVERLVRGEHADPFSLLGPHIVEAFGERRMLVRTFQPRAAAVALVHESSKEPLPALKVHEAGLYEATLPFTSFETHRGLNDTTPPAYKLKIDYPGGGTQYTYDAYAFAPLLTEFDLHLIGEGTHYKKYEKLGAHVCQVAGVSGVQFGVWAPNARRVSVVGNFNHWDGRTQPMRSRGLSGVWELFIPYLTDGEVYKFEILAASGRSALKADPYGFYAEVRPRTGSVVFDINRYAWNDAAWIEQREKANHLERPLAVYEVHLGSWRRGENGRWLGYEELGDQLIPYVQQLGYTHMELLPVMEHPFDGSWGYQTLGYFAATSRFGTPADFMRFVDRCHAAGLGVILDWTPAHFPRDAHGLGFFDGSHLYEHSDPRKGAHPDWGTLVFNYGRNEVQNFLISNALFWMDKFHIDGIRVDAVASMLYLDYSRGPGEWTPNQYGGRENLEAIAFLKRLNEVVHAAHPGVLTIAEESTSWPMVSRPTYLGGLGFSLKWTMGWMHDTLKYFHQDPIYRKFHHSQMTFSLVYAFSENFVLPFSHDEVVHLKRALLDKMTGDMWQKYANLRLLYAYMYGHPGKKLLFMGGEFGQWREWNHDTQLSWDLLRHWGHAGLQRLAADLNRIYRAEPALYEADFDWRGFEWLDCHDADNSTFSFLRRAKATDDCVVVVCNCTPVVRENYRVGVPEAGFYQELLNTDAASYGGSNVGNFGGVEAEAVPWIGHSHSLRLTLPPLGAIFLAKRRAPGK
jgi:1,4-alpha-glucan branching enzyme